MKYLKVVNQTTSDGVGLRMSIYFSGCIHHCEGCHNESSWNPKFGHIVDSDFINKIITAYQKNPLLDGITLTGGDPLYNFDDFENFIKIIKKALDCNIWVYTGYEYEQIMNNDFMKYIDILVDGKFQKELFNPELIFRGSSNQRIIDVKKTRQQGEVVTIYND